jgi:hypothetical protein
MKECAFALRHAASTRDCMQARVRSDGNQWSNQGSNKWSNQGGNYVAIKGAIKGAIK